MRTIDDMIRQEVLCCVSPIISTLANGSGCINTQDSFGRDLASSLSELCEQALELSAPIPDYEEAARENGFEKSDAGHIIRYDTNNEAQTAETWEEACELAMCDPYDREVFEHWAVSEWFAEKLVEHGERVDTDFANMCVWARTTTGQGIASDGVIERIYAATHKAGV